MKEPVNILVFLSEIEADCLENSEHFPVDRYFIKKYLSQILEYDKIEFIASAFNLNNQTFSVHLMLCLPELWDEITYSDIIDILKQLDSEIAIFSMIEFTYKYVEINIIDDCFNSKYVNTNLQISVKSYLKSQYNNLYKSEFDYLCYNEGIWGVTIDEWQYIKQKILLDERILPCLESVSDLMKYVTAL